MLNSKLAALILHPPAIFRLYAQSSAPLMPQLLLSLCACIVAVYLLSYPAPAQSAAQKFTWYAYAPPERTTSCHRRPPLRAVTLHQVRGGDAMGLHLSPQRGVVPALAAVLPYPRMDQR